MFVKVFLNLLKTGQISQSHIEEKYKIMKEELSEIIEKVAKIKIDEMKGNSKSKKISDIKKDIY